MWGSLIFLLAAWGNQPATDTVRSSKGEVFIKRVVAKQLSDPWEITYAPNNYLWITEAKGYRVSKINPADGSKKVLLDINSTKNFGRYDKIKGGKVPAKPWPQGGLMGLALHPDFLNNKPFVYLSYLYNFKGADVVGDGCEPDFGGCFFTTRIVRYRYDKKNDTLLEPQILCDSIPGSNDHNGGRLLIASMDGKAYVFYGIGEMGAGQYVNGGRLNKAQNVKSYEGKILRFNAEPDSDRNVYDKWLPNDNPFNEKRQSAVWSMGHRNPQGLAYAAGRLYSSEHGPFSDDEINLIEKGMNYGHPLVLGYNDGNYNSLAAGASNKTQLRGPWYTSYPTIVNEQANANAIGAAYRNPIKSLYPTPANTLQYVVKKATEGIRTGWVSEAPSSLDIYTSTAIPGWKNSLLMTSLKNGHLVRLPLNEKGDALTGDTIHYFKNKARYRDLALATDGSKVYLTTDSSTTTSGPTIGSKEASDCRGCIIEFSYVGTGRQAAINRVKSSLVARRKE